MEIKHSSYQLSRILVGSLLSVVSGSADKNCETEF